MTGSSNSQELEKTRLSSFEKKTGIDDRRGFTFA